MSRILYVLDRFPVLSQTFVRNEVAQLRELGHAVSVVTARPPVRFWGPGDDLGGPGRAAVGRLLPAHLRLLRRHPRRYLAYLRVLAGGSPRDAVFSLWAPQAALTGWDSEHLHTHFAFRAASFARAVAALSGATRSVTTHANDLFVQESGLRSRLAGARVLTISEFNQRYLAERGIASEVTHCGVDLAAMPSPAGSRSVDVVFVGRMVEKKGPTTFVEAVDLLQRRTQGPVRVLMVGDGPMLEDCRRLTDRLGCTIELVGGLQPEQTLAAVAGSRCLCLPAQRDAQGDQDGIPVVLMEAMALGTPVVTTSVSGIPELVRPGAGWLVDPDAPDLPDRLAAAMAECLAEPTQADARSTRAREIVAESFTLEAQALAVAEAGARRGVVTG